MGISRRLLVAGLVVAAACRGQHEGPGEVTKTPVPAPAVTARATAQASAYRHFDPAPPKQILFGDLHVHTTISADAFIRSLPMLQGEGAHPPADACDYARFCSGLDFWSINDHAEAISPQHWQETKESIRQCNAVAGDPQNPDLVAFLGWEWTQVGLTKEDHYGHKNVILRETAEDKVPVRPISALDMRLIGALRQRAPLWQRIRFPILDWSNRQRYFDFGLYQEELLGVPLCPTDVDTRKLPVNCHEYAQTPQALFEKLAQWGGDAFVIPHGTTWGFYTPPGVTMDKQLTAAQHDPQKQFLIEIYSGHGNSEEYRSWKDIDFDAAGSPVCPAPTKNYEPCCWRAGELIRARCGNATKDECERRVKTAQLNYLNAGAAGNQTVPGATLEEWGDCGQCRDCFNPAFTSRPGDSVQYATAITNFDDPQHPRRFHFGFIAASDNHSARPGTGYKEFGRRINTETAGARDEAWYGRLVPPRGDRSATESRPFSLDAAELGRNFFSLDIERQASFFMTGGLVAVHSGGRSRDNIWSALKQKEVYATSGERILLWFDLVNGPQGALPMGSETALADIPTFRVRAVGSFKQKPGCPEHSTSSLSADRLRYLCRGECYNPSDERRLITRIEVIRIRPQQRPGEPVADLIQDPWQTFPCPPDQAGCEVTFADPNYPGEQREVAYYVRAVQEPTPAINAGGLRCRYDANGNCVEVHPCYGDYRTPYDEDCLAQNEERAWSSPIYVRP